MIKINMYCQYVIIILQLVTDTVPSNEHILKIELSNQC